MNNKHLWIASLSGALMSLLLANLPFVNLVNLLLCAGFWASAIFAIWMYRRLGEKVTILEGVKVGALSGLIAWAAGFLLSFAGLAGIQGIMSGAGQFLPAEAAPGMQEIPAWSATLLNLAAVIFEVAFGIVGGCIGAALFRTERKPSGVVEPVPTVNE